jgi:hypothetical protein
MFYKKTVPFLCGNKKRAAFTEIPGCDTWMLVTCRPVSQPEVQVLDMGLISCMRAGRKYINCNGTWMLKLLAAIHFLLK